MKHPLGSPYVRDQLSLRTIPLNEKRLQPEGEFVLYWMQTTQRLDDNWALRMATIEADRVGKPLLIHQGLDPSYAYASARFHTFIMQGAREMARRADALGLTYRFALRCRRDDDRRVLDRLAARAALVVTDLFPTAGVSDRSQRFADRVNCRVLAVDSVGVVPAASFHKEEYAARTIRPKIAKLLDLVLEPVDDRLPRRTMSPALLASLDVEWLDILRCDIAAEVARCEIDHEVRPVATRGGLRAGRPARLRRAAAPPVGRRRVEPPVAVSALRDDLAAGGGERRATGRVRRAGRGVPERDAHLARAVAQLLPAQSQARDPGRATRVGAALHARARR
jgi:hypothetical protein